MKKSLLIALLLTTVSVTAQTEDKKIKEIRKEVRVEDENGVRTVEIITVENGQETKEVYTGAEADQKLAELESQAITEESKVKTWACTYFQLSNTRRHGNWVSRERPCLVNRSVWRYTAHNFSTCTIGANRQTSTYNFTITHDIRLNTVVFRCS